MSTVSIKLEERNPVGYDSQIIASILRQILAQQVIAKTEHQVILQEQSGYDVGKLVGILQEIKGELQKPIQPSAELEVIARILSQILAEQVFIKDELKKPPESWHHIVWNLYWKATP